MRARCLVDAVPLIVHAFVATTAMARSVTYLIQAATARTHPVRLGRAADHESSMPPFSALERDGKHLATAIED